MTVERDARPLARQDVVDAGGVAGGDQVAGFQRAAAARRTREREREGGTQPAGQRGRASLSDLPAVDRGGARQRGIAAMGPVRDLDAHHQAIVVAEVGHDDTRTQLIDRRQRTAGDFHAGEQRRWHGGGLFRRPVELAGWRIRVQSQHVFGFHRAEAALEHFEDRLTTGGHLQLLCEDRPQQALVAGRIAALGRDESDLPSDHPVRPLRDRQILDAVGGNEVVGDIAGKARQSPALAARADETVRDGGQCGHRGARVGEGILVVAQVGSPRCVLLHCRVTVQVDGLYMVNRCH